MHWCWQQGEWPTLRLGPPPQRHKREISARSKGRAIPYLLLPWLASLSPLPLFPLSLPLSPLFPFFFSCGAAFRVLIEAPHACWKFFARTHTSKRSHSCAEQALAHTAHTGAHRHTGARARWRRISARLHESAHTLTSLPLSPKNACACGDRRSLRNTNEGRRRRRYGRTGFWRRGRRGWRGKERGREGEIEGGTAKGAYQRASVGQLARTTCVAALCLNNCVSWKRLLRGKA